MLCKIAEGHRYVDTADSPSEHLCVRNCVSTCSLLENKMPASPNLNYLIKLVSYRPRCIVLCSHICLWNVQYFHDCIIQNFGRSLKRYNIYNSFTFYMSSFCYVYCLIKNRVCMYKYFKKGNNVFIQFFFYQHVCLQ